MQQPTVTTTFTTVIGTTAAEDIIKKSRFIAYACPAPKVKDGYVLLEYLKREHPKARHICWAWQHKGTVSLYSDDGEPGGTAGPPILTAIQSEGLSETFVACVRYFGGTLLGTGGLIKAYGGTAKKCLQGAERVVKVPTVSVRIEAPMALVGAVYSATSASAKCTRLNEEFTADSIVLTVLVELEFEKELITRVTDACKGASSVTRVAEESS